MRSLEVTGPLGTRVVCQYGIITETKTAVFYRQRVHRVKIEIFGNANVFESVEFFCDEFFTFLGMAESSIPG